MNMNSKEQLSQFWNQVMLCTGKHSIEELVQLNQQYHKAENQGNCFCGLMQQKSEKKKQLPEDNLVLSLSLTHTTLSDQHTSLPRIRLLRSYHSCKRGLEPFSHTQRAHFHFAIHSLTHKHAYTQKHMRIHRHICSSVAHDYWDFNRHLQIVMSSF